MKISMWKFLILGLAALAPASARADGGCDRPARTIAPFATMHGDGILNLTGIHIAQWEDWVAIGTPRELASRGATDGAVRLYQRTGAHLHLRQTFYGKGLQQAGSGDRFGSGIVMANGWMLVAAASSSSFGEGVFTGEVTSYELRGGEWRERETFASPTLFDGGAFGSRTFAGHIGMNAAGDLALIGENRGVGDRSFLHVYRRTGGAWKLVETLGPPPEVEAEFAQDGFPDTFADDVVYAGGNLFLVSSSITREADLSETTRVHAYAVSAEGHATLVQTIAKDGNVLRDPVMFGEGAGIAVQGGLAVFGDPSDDSAGLEGAGALRLYSVTPGAATPLVLVDTLTDPEAVEFGFLGSSGLGITNHLSVATDGRRILAGSAAGPGFVDFDEEAGLEFVNVLGQGSDVVLFERRCGSWKATARLTSSKAPGIDRMFGETVAFLGGGLAAVSETAFDDGDSVLYLYQLGGGEDR